MRVPLMATTLVASTMLLTTVSVDAQRGPRRGGRPPQMTDRGGEDSNNQNRSSDDKFKAYDEVITDEAKSDPGLMLVHRVDDKIYYEIPTDALDRDMLWVTQIEKTQTGFSYGGTPVGERVVRWEMHGDKILLRDVNYQIRAREGDESIMRAVEASSVAPIIRTFDIKAWGKDRRPVIDVTELFTSDVQEFSAARRLGASGADSSRTFIDVVKSFPENVESKILMTYRLSGGPGGGGRGGSPFGGQRRDPTQSGVTVLLHHSMVMLPSDPMEPRRHDSRVGFFTVGFDDFGTEKHQVEEVRYITRWRLEKQDPDAEVSDPVKPIVFYVGRGVPERWRPYVRKGIEMWQPAFEKAGFSNAILAKDAPTTEEDPDWDAEDARYSSIRWLPSNVENAMGPHVNDPRTGEILESDILMYHNVLKLCRDWYFIQASPNDERAQQLPLPDELVGELLAYVVAHEVGHTLGFPHNMKASSAYTIEQLRDPEFTAKYGTEASIMDYGRFNYVAQPGDGAALIPKIGPYDFFAVEWGYRRWSSEEEEKAGLAALIAQQKENDDLLFGPGNSREDPTDQTEDLGDNSIEATHLGLQNLQRVAGYLVSATSREGEDYDLLDNMYGELIGQFGREVGHVANVVGGVERRNFWYGDADKRYFPVTGERQRQAVRFLLDNAFHIPAPLITTDITMRLEATGTADRFLSLHRRLISQMMNDSRAKRMAELAERTPEGAYTPLDMVDDLRNGIFSELEESTTSINLYRRNLQRAFADALIEQVRRTDASSDLPAIARGQLERIRIMIDQALSGERDEITVLHLRDVDTRIAKALDLEEDAPTVTTASTANIVDADHDHE